MYKKNSRSLEPWKIVKQMLKQEVIERDKINGHIDLLSFSLDSLVFYQGMFG